MKYVLRRLLKNNWSKRRIVEPGGFFSNDQFIHQSTDYGIQILPITVGHRNKNNFTCYIETVYLADPYNGNSNEPYRNVLRCLGSPSFNKCYSSCRCYSTIVRSPVAHIVKWSYEEINERSSYPKEVSWESRVSMRCKNYNGKRW